MGKKPMPTNGHGVIYTRRGHHAALARRNKCKGAEHERRPTGKQLSIPRCCMMTDSAGLRGVKLIQRPIMLWCRSVADHAIEGDGGPVTLHDDARGEAGS